MRPLDWVVFFAWLVLLISYGLWRSRGSNTVNQFLLAGKTMPWYAMGLSIMATQAGAITFISTPGQHRQHPDSGTDPDGMLRFASSFRS